jgi:DNA polymerase III gamma/tau subunit
MQHLNHANFYFIHAFPRSKSASDSDPYTGLSDEDIALIREERQKLCRDPYYDLNIPKANHILISSMREMKRKLLSGQAEAGRQVVFIHQAERCTEHAFGALLKILEEPPRQTTFILTTAYAQLLPETIRSRCQILKCHMPPAGAIVEYLRQKGHDETTAQRISNLCGGNVRLARSLAESDFSELDTSILNVWRIIMASKIKDRWVSMEDMNALIEQYVKIYKDTPQEFRNHLRYMIFFLRDAQLLESAPDAESRIINAQLLNQLKNFVKFYPGFPYFDMIKLIEKTLSDTDSNVYLPALLGRLFMELRLHCLHCKKVQSHATQ